MTLHGVIYLHRITDLRMGGISLRFFKLFRKICDDNTLRNLVIAEWDMHDEKRVQQFTDERFFKPALHQEAYLFRHDNTIKSAQKILLTICKNHPMPSNIRREVASQRNDLSITVTDMNAGNPDVVSIAYVISQLLDQSQLIWRLELFSVMGASGSGKSTVGNAICMNCVCS